MEEGGENSPPSLGVFSTLALLRVFPLILNISSLIIHKIINRKKEVKYLYTKTCSTQRRC